MRDFRDAKAMARTLRTAMAAKGARLSQAEAFELTAKMFGERDWNTLAAAIAAAGEPAATPRPEAARPPPGAGPFAPAPPRRAGGTYFSAALEKALHRAVALASGRKHTHATIEHLLLALVEDSETQEVLRACQVDIEQLRGRLTTFVDHHLQSLVHDDEPPALPTAAFHRVIQRAVIHVQSSGRDQVTGANVLVAIFSEQESHAAAFLAEQQMERSDAVNFIAHGVRKDGRAA